MVKHTLGRRRRSGFTLLELLLVVAILGITLAAVVPRLGGLLEGGQTAVAARIVSQAGRYARSMALLNQLPLDLVLRLDTAEVRVEVASDTPGPDSPRRDGASRFSGWLTPEGGRTEPADAGGIPKFGLAQSRTDRMDATRGLGLRTGASDDTTNLAEWLPEERGGLAAELSLQRKLEGVQLEFGGFQDRSDGFHAEPATQGEVRVRYRANGTCRPYQVAVQGVRTGERFLLSVDSVGSPRLTHADGPLAGGSR